MESILVSIKKLLGMGKDYTPFDSDIIMHINAVFMVLNQLGVGPPEGFYITDDSSVWSDFAPDSLNIGAIKSYMYLKVKLIFDPPTSSAVIESINRQISEYEWRINVAAEKSTPSEEVIQNEQL